MRGGWPHPRGSSEKLVCVGVRCPRVPTSHPSPPPRPVILLLLQERTSEAGLGGRAAASALPWPCSAQQLWKPVPCPAQGSVARRDDSAWSCILGPGLPRGQPRTPCAPRRAGRSLGLLHTWGPSSPAVPWPRGPAHGMLGDLGQVPSTHRASVSLRHGSVRCDDAARVGLLDSLPAPPWVPLYLSSTPGCPPQPCCPRGSELCLPRPIEARPPPPGAGEVQREGGVCVSSGSPARGRLCLVWERGGIFLCVCKQHPFSLVSKRQ